MRQPQANAAARWSMRPHRHRQRLLARKSAALEHRVPARAMLLGHERTGRLAAMEGIASRVRRDQEGANTVLRFGVKEQDGTPAAVEMRGHEIRGVLDDGDRVLLVAGPQRAPADGIHRPMQVENLTTGSTVTAWRPSRLERAAKPLPTALLTAAISSGVTFCFAALFTADERPTAARLAVMRAGAPTGSRSSPRRSWASWP